MVANKEDAQIGEGKKSMKILRNEIEISMLDAGCFRGHTSLLNIPMLQPVNDMACPGVRQIRCLHIVICYTKEGEVCDQANQRGSLLHNSHVSV